jgi:hypothetical protein
MSRFLPRILVISLLLVLIAACTREVEPPAKIDLLQNVPADTPYAFVTSRRLPDGLRDRLADYYAAQLAAQGPVFARLRKQMEEAEEAAPMARQAERLFDVLEALFGEFEGRDTAAKVRELGIEPVTRSVIYGIGVLPALRVEIIDAAKLEAMLDRVEARAGFSTTRGESNGQAYRRIDLGQVDLILSITKRHAIAGLLADGRFERDLPLLLGQAQPSSSLADSGDIESLIEQYGFTGYGEGFLRLDELVRIMLGKGNGRNAEVMQALGAQPVPISAGCMQMTEQLISGMPRMVIGISAADQKRLAARGIWESSAPVAARLQKLAAPVPGLGAPYDGLLAMGFGLDLPQLRNAIDALLREVIAAGDSCEWVDPASLKAVMPQLNLALGPMTAGIKGINLLLADLSIDSQTLQPLDVRAGLLAAVDDPRGIFALGAMFNPALATFEFPADGSFVDLPRDLVPDEQAPPLKVAIKERALLLLAGSDSNDVADSLLGATVTSPSPLFAVDYGVYQLVERFGAMTDGAIAQLESQGEQDVATELREQMRNFRLQAELFDRLRVSLYADAQGLVMDQVMELR